MCPLSMGRAWGRCPSDFLITDILMDYYHRMPLQATSKRFLFLRSREKYLLKPERSNPTCPPLHWLKPSSTLALNTTVVWPSSAGYQYCSQDKDFMTQLYLLPEERNSQTRYQQQPQIRQMFIERNLKRKKKNNYYLQQETETGSLP